MVTGAWRVEYAEHGDWVATDPDCPRPGLDQSELCGGSGMCDCQVFHSTVAAIAYIDEMQAVDDLVDLIRGDV